MCDPQITIALCKFFDELFVFVISVFFGRDLKKIVKSKQMHVFMSTWRTFFFHLHMETILAVAEIMLTSFRN